MPKNRNVWILPHCLATEKTVQIVEFDAALFWGGIMLPEKVKPSNLGASSKDKTSKDIKQFKLQNSMSRTIKV